jgi:MFS family permease
MASSTELDTTIDTHVRSATQPTTWQRHRTYVVLMLFVAYFLNSIDRNIINILQQSIKTEFGLLDWQLGMMTGFAFAMFYALIGIATARLIDRGAVRTAIIAGGLALWSVATSLCGVAQNFWQLALCRAGVGVGEGSFGPSAMTLTSDYYGPNERARAMGFYLMGLPVGSLVGLAAAGWIAQHYGWRAALMVVGLPGLAVALLIKLTVREPQRGLADGRPIAAPPALPIRAVVAAGMRKKTFVHLTIAALLASFCTVGSTQWFPTYLQRGFHLNLAEIGAAWGPMTGLAGMVGAFGGGWVVDRFSARHPRWFMIIPAIAMAASLPFYVAAALAPSFWLCFACLIVPATLNNLWIPAGMALTQGLAPLAMRALLGMFVTFVANLFGHGIAPPVIGGLSDWFGHHLGSDFLGLRWALIAIAIFYPWAAVHFWLASRTAAGDLENGG